VKGENREREKQHTATPRSIAYFLNHTASVCDWLIGFHMATNDVFDPKCSVFVPWAQVEGGGEPVQHKHTALGEPGGVHVQHTHSREAWGKLSCIAIEVFEE
jgi:hypothetical protein